MSDASRKHWLTILAVALLYYPAWGFLASDWLWWDWFTTTVEWPWWSRNVGIIRGVWFTLSLVLGGWLSWRASRQSNLSLSVTATLFYPAWWHWLVYVTKEANVDFLRVFAANAGLGGLFCLGLCWLVWLLERASQYYHRQRYRQSMMAAQKAHASSGQTTVPELTGEERIHWHSTGRWIWNPFDTAAWYYGGRGQKLTQSVFFFMNYGLVFWLAFMLFSRVSGCKEIYESPAGGGEQKTITQAVKIQKVIKKKFVINPYSSISFNPPPIDDVKLQLEEATAHLYKVGMGSGEGAGFSAGTKRGKVRFIRLEYAGGDWDQDFGIGADVNMLLQYGVLTSQPVAEKTESRTISQLRNFPIGKSPPFVFITGQKNITLSQSEMKTLREYLLDKHGMLFCDNGGSQHFHNQFFAMMRGVLPEVQPVKVPLDDTIHRVPFAIPFLPYVAPHGGRDAWGWKVDGRWVAYYHPGDIGDAWADDHSGVPREIWEACYQLGTNVMFYAHLEYNKWQEAQKKDTK